MGVYLCNFVHICMCKYKRAHQNVFLYKCIRVYRLSVVFSLKLRGKNTLLAGFLFDDVLRKRSSHNQARIKSNARTNSRTHTCSRMHTYACTHTQRHAHTLTYGCTYIYAHLNTNTHVCTCMYACTHIHLDAYMNTYIHTDMYSYTRAFTAEF